MSKSGEFEANASSGSEAAPSLGRLEAALREAAKTQNRPPVHLWNPPYCGELDIRIRRDGLWSYLGTPIGREPLVRLFASILKREADGRYYLVTPVEKVGIIVEDAPFIGVDIESEGVGAARRVMVETNLGERVVIGPEHPMRVERAENGELTPYVEVRDSLEARMDRKSLFRLADVASWSADGRSYGVWSDGAFFALESAEALGDVSPD